MAAPGLAMVAASPRGWAAMETATMPRFYLDLRRTSRRRGRRPDAVDAGDRGRLPGRRGPAADAGRGRGGVFARHEACAAATRAGLAALGFELFADQRLASKTVTAALVPEGLDWKAFNGEIKRRGARPRRRPGQAHRQDLPARPPRLGDGRGDPRRDRMLETVTIEQGRPVAPGRRRSPRPSAQRSTRWASPAGRRRRRAREGPRRRAIAPEGVDRLRAHHDVDERPGLTREELCVDPARVRRARRPQPGPGRRRADRRGHPAARHRPGRRRRRQRRPRGGDPGRDHRRQRADRQHDRRRRAHARAALRPRPADRRRRRVGPARRVEARPVHGPRAARPDARDRRPRQDRPGDRGARPGDGDDVLGADPYVTAEQAAQPRRGAGRARRLLARSDVITVHVPLTRRRAGLIGARRIARMKPGALLLNVARGGVVDEAAVADGARARAARRRRHRRLRGRAADRLAAARRAEHAAHAAPRRVDRRGPGRCRRGGRRARSSTCSTAAPPATRSTRRCSRPRPRRRSRRTCRSPRCSAGSSPSSRRSGVGTLTLEIAGELARARRLAADRGRAARPARDVDHRAGQPRQRRSARARPAASRSSSARRPMPASSPPAHAVTGTRRARRDRRRARSPAASRASSGSTTTGSTWRRPT